MTKSLELSASQERYLKAIFYIVSENHAARAKDISKFLGVGSSSVTEAMQSLVNKGLINYTPYGLITLTLDGMQAAQDLVKRNEIISDFLENVLSVERDKAKENADKIEYGISNDVLDKFVSFLEFMKTCSCKDPKWIKSFKHYSLNNELTSKCSKCVASCQENPDLHSNKSCCGMVN